MSNALREVSGSNIGYIAYYSDIFRGFSQFFQASAGIVRLLGEIRFFPPLFQCRYHYPAIVDMRTGKLAVP